jgi:hypothetical protein
MATFARVLTFHLPSEQITSLLEIFDERLAPRYASHPAFGGLLSLELREGSSRSQIYVVSLWDDTLVKDSTDIADRWWDDASEVLGIGIARHRCRVLRDIPGHTPDGS